jgi:hypothetical protein
LLLPLLEEEEELSDPESESESEDDEEEDDDEEEEEEELTDPLLWAANNSCCACICKASNLGAFFKCSRRASVKPPSPMEVKKLIAKRVFLKLSVGNSPPNTCCM